MMSPQVQALLSNGNGWSAPTFVSKAYIGSASFAGALLDINRNYIYASNPTELAYGVAGGMMAALTVKALWSSDHLRAGPTLWKAEVAGKDELMVLETRMDAALQPPAVRGCVRPQKRLNIWAYVGPAAPVFQTLASQDLLLQQHIGSAEKDAVIPYTDIDKDNPLHGKGYRIPGGWIFAEQDGKAVNEVPLTQKACKQAADEYVKPQAVKKSLVTSEEFFGASGVGTSVVGNSGSGAAVTTKAAGNAKTGGSEEAAVSTNSEQAALKAALKAG